MFRKTLLALLALLPLASLAHDDDEEHHQKRARVDRTTAQWERYETECGSCHLAYAPSMLPARSWQALLAGLDDHFGQNAELDDATRGLLETWLVQQAGREVRGATPLRITALPWWRHEHDELAPATFRRKAILTPANCGACHPGAKDGAFNEHAVKIPRDAPAPR